MLFDVLGSATAGVISRMVTHPLDTAKARLQAPVAFTGGRPTTTFRGPADALLLTYQREGIRALYAGFGAVIIGGTPGTVLYLTGYEYFRDSISSVVMKWNEGNETTSAERKNNKPSLSPVQEFSVYVSSGILAEALACIIYVPVDVVKERMQVQQKVGASQNYQYNGSWDALRQIIRTEGMRGIYKGYGATLASFGPFSALYFMFYEQCKLWSKEYIHQQSQDIETRNRVTVKDGELPLIHLVACSAGSGALASWLTSPLDMAKLRLQVQRGKAATAASITGDGMSQHTEQYRGMIDCLRAAYREGGIRGLYRGAGARVLHFAPAMTITMTCYEKFRAFYAEALG